VCLGIPGRIVAFDASTDQLARAEVMGAQRVINIGLLADEGVAIGDWVIVHLGFALEIIDEDGAAAAREGLELMGRADPLRDPPAATAEQEPR
jgi:hydrogenase expression/formation protein HypC